MTDEFLDIFTETLVILSPIFKILLSIISLIMIYKIFSSVFEVDLVDDFLTKIDEEHNKKERMRQAVTVLDNRKFILVFYKTKNNRREKTVKTYDFSKLENLDAIKKLHQIAEIIRMIEEKNINYYASFVQNDLDYFLTFLSEMCEHDDFFNIRSELNDFYKHCDSLDRLVNQCIQEEKDNYVKVVQPMVNDLLKQHEIKKEALKNKNKMYTQ